MVHHSNLLRYFRTWYWLNLFLALSSVMFPNVIACRPGFGVVDKHWTEVKREPWSETCLDIARVLFWAPCSYLLSTLFQCSSGQLGAHSTWLSLWSFCSSASRLFPRPRMTTLPRHSMAWKLGSVKASRSNPQPTGHRSQWINAQLPIFWGTDFSVPQWAPREAELQSL